jgi:DNA topoisomerase VI subunit A
VVASEKGVVVGRLQFTEDGDHIDCTKMGVGGKAIPPNVDKVRCRITSHDALLMTCTTQQPNAVNVRHT